MQATFVLVSFLCYAFIVLQYKFAGNLKTTNLVKLSSERPYLNLLNKRTIRTMPPMLSSIGLCMAMGKNNFLQWTLSAESDLQTLLVLCICLLVSIYTVEYSARVKAVNISTKQIIAYLGLRVPGLVLYEVFFCGVLLRIFLEWFTVPTAITFNTVLYAIAHAFGQRKLFIASIPFGLLVCYVTVANGSVLPAILIHLAVALPLETMLLTNWQLKHRGTYQ